MNSPKSGQKRDESTQSRKRYLKSTRYARLCELASSACWTAEGGCVAFVGGERGTSGTVTGPLTARQHGEGPLPRPRCSEPTGGSFSASQPRPPSLALLNGNRRCGSAPAKPGQVREHHWLTEYPT